MFISVSGYAATQWTITQLVIGRKSTWFVTRGRNCDAKEASKLPPQSLAGYFAVTQWRNLGDPRNRGRTFAYSLLRSENRHTETREPLE